MPRQIATCNLLPELPIHSRLTELSEALAQGHAVLTAQPGSGKTTLVPLLLLDEPWLGGRKILMLEPRRPAARMAARRMAELLQERVGQRVGYQVRFERRISARTRIEVLTEGLLLRRLQADPELKGVGLLIFDEFHERNLQADLSLALSLDAASGLRDDLRLLVMSATLDPGPLLALMPATAVQVPGRLYPVEVLQAESDGDLRDPVPGCMRALARAVTRTSGDVLVFLPGRREIERMRGEVVARWGHELEAKILYGEMRAVDQDAVLQGSGGRRRVILATDIAETSLTIDGVQAVVDSGLARKPLFDPNTGLTYLHTRWISKASAQQRAGRAGRQGPGWCFRSWNLARLERLEDWTAPEILRADLAALVLELANWGLDAPGALRWLDPPPEAHWRQASDLLRQLGAIDAKGRITAAGRRMVLFPTHPRLAHVLDSAVVDADRRMAADVAAVLSERDPLRRGAGAQQGADIEDRLALLDAWRDRTLATGVADAAGLKRIDQAAQQFLRLCADRPQVQSTTMTAGRCLALAYPDRMAICSSPDGQRYLMRNGRAALLDEADPLRGSPFLAVAAVGGGRRNGLIRLAARIEQEEFEDWFGAEVQVERELRWDANRGDLVARRVRRLDALRLADEAVPLEADDPVAEILIEQVRAQGLAAFFQDPVELRARVELMRTLDGVDEWPDFSERGLLDSMEQWLLPWLRPGQGARQLQRISLPEVLGAWLGWQRTQRLDRQLPTRFDTPAGTRRPIQYSLDGTAVLAVPLQEMLGLQAGPRLAGGRVELVMHLLSPAGRPLQVTSDLAAFWAGAYAEVKKEMRGRYPKHFWPDDPAQARATRFTKRGMQKDP